VRGKGAIVGGAYTRAMDAPLLIVSPQARDLGGGFVVRRLLPSVQRAAVGPFVFFDHFGPIVAGAQDDHDVRPHPHIGLATVTYLFEGAMMHRDSIGAVQRIEPGAINLMRAGAGVVHSERTPDDLRGRTRVSHGLQLWLALPAADEEAEPAFTHTGAADIPALQVGAAQVRVLVGAAFGVMSPVPQYSPTLYLDIALPAGAAIDLPGGLADEAALYTVDAPVALNGAALAAQRLAVFDAGRALRIAASEPARLAIVGGAPLGQRHMWWNFVSSRRERIVQAADDWAAQRFAPVPGETEFIPLPEKRPRA
jgi:redox-sensitive bicupin YhaK (pirin superfamily)